MMPCFILTFIIFYSLVMSSFDLLFVSPGVLVEKYHMFLWFIQLQGNLIRSKNIMEELWQKNSFISLYAWSVLFELGFVLNYGGNSCSGLDCHNYCRLCRCFSQMNCWCSQTLKKKLFLHKLNQTKVLQIRIAKLRTKYKWNNKTHNNEMWWFGYKFGSIQCT